MKLSKFFQIFTKEIEKKKKISINIKIIPMKTKQPKSKIKRRNDFSEFIDTLIQRFEASPSIPLQINSLSNESGVEKRRLYDLMNVLVACGVCTRRDTHTFAWNGISASKDTLQQISKDFEERSIRDRPEQIFLLPDSPAIGLISTTFIATFLYMGVKTLGIRDASLIMANDEEHSKPILRRLYLVAFLLERIGILTHSQKIGEYSLNENIEKITEQSLTDLAKENKFSPDSIEFQLSRFGKNYMMKLYKSRQLAFARQLQIRTRTKTNTETLIINPYAIQSVDA
ncbi:hypothetical protein TRFO_21226 [Tritrichomonas foetus]|uniref:E2F/DP family winged-helix DNA-binding domain-containing protein n=1 Tax=Tritrichomonas foetus TaxID=1144522 RepID=A0A1J4KE65_9EUKA|nr:hypothetical protein TRFO_21226 [Tritrichomonas foetus]|eukprot:OHT09721.1 hypothetical protein TRFO_21226 [Tritrichomonas foetus]